jgi:hypothetical protein
MPLVALIFFSVADLRAQIRIVETPLATLRLSETNGDLVGIHWKNPNLEIIDEPKLGENFRLLVPQNDYQANYFDSRNQRVAEIKSLQNGVLLTYSSIKNERETLPIKVDYSIQAIDGQVQFSIDVDNPTDRKPDSATRAICRRTYPHPERIRRFALLWPLQRHL